MMKTSKYKYIIAAVACLLAISSCTDDENNGGKGLTDDNVIALRLPRASSRGAELGSDGFNEVYVSAFLGSHNSSDGRVYFENIPFTYARTVGEARIFESTPSYYWPVTNLEFFAFCPSVDGELSNTEAGYKLNGFKVDANIAEQIDFIATHASGSYDDYKNADVKGVTMTFNHQLSQVAVKGISNNKYYDFEVAGIRLGKTAVGGDFNFCGDSHAESPSKPTGMWENLVDGNAEYIFRPGDATVTLSENSSSFMGGGGNAMLIPNDRNAWEGKAATAKWNSQNYAYSPDGMYISVLGRITAKDEPDRVIYPYTAYTAPNQTPMQKVYFIVDGENKIVASDVDSQTVPQAGQKLKAFGWVAIPVAAAWEAGKRYVYTLDFSKGFGLHDPSDPEPGKPIVDWEVSASVSVEPWVEEENFDVDLDSGNVKPEQGESQE